MGSKLLIVAITGGIGSGKSFAINIFRKLNTPVIIADHIAKNVLLDNEELAVQIKKYFNVVDLSLKNLKKIRLEAFKNVIARSFLQTLIHPEVITKINSQITELKEKNIHAIKNNYCIIEIPLVSNFLEIITALKIDRIIFIKCDLNLQISRVMHRDHLSRRQVLSVINFQNIAKKKLENTINYFINNNTTTDLFNEILLLHSKFNIINNNLI